MSITNVSISRAYEGGGSGTLFQLKKVDKVDISHDTTNGKDLITVVIDGELLFQYDANLKEEI